MLESATRSERTPARRGDVGAVPRRDALTGGAALTLGIGSLVLPRASAHASGGGGADAVDWTFDRPVQGVRSHVVGGAEGFIVLSASTPNEDGVPARMTRLRSETVIDAGFNTRVIPALETASFVGAADVQADLKVVAVGSIDGEEVFITRVGADGGADTDFIASLPIIAGGIVNGSPSNYGRTVLIAPSGRILIGGTFLTATTDTGVVERHGLLQLLPDGTLDPVFAPAEWPGYGFAAVTGPFEVTTLVRLADGDVVVGGGFTSSSGGDPPQSLFRVDGVTGALRASFEYPRYQGISSISLLADGSLLVCDVAGAVLRVDSATGAVLQELLTVTVPDDPFAAPTVRAVASEGAGSFLLAGFFTRIGGVARSSLARISVDLGSTPPTATVASTFTPTLGITGQGGIAGANAIAFRPSGGVALGGFFTTVNGEPRPHFALLTADGTLAS